MNIELIAYQKEFLPNFMAWREQPSSVRHNPLMPTTEEKVAAMLEKGCSDLSKWESIDSFRWFIRTQDGSVVGNISLKNINRMMMYAELGYGVSETHQGQGIATAAVRALTKKIFAETSLRKLFAYVHDKNIPSCRVLEKVGFQREGLLREHYIINGTPENEVFYGLLRSDAK